MSASTKLASLPSPTVQDRLLEAAGKVFGEKGSHSATVREITALAGSNVAAINYYFRDKEVLYAVALRHALQASERQDEPYDESLPPDEQLHQFIVELLQHLLDPNRPEWHGRLMAREMTHPTGSLDLVVRELIQPRIAIFRRIVCAIVGRELFSKQLSLLLLSVVGQCVYYRQSAPIVDRLFPNLMVEPGIITDLARHITKFSLAGIHTCGNPSART